MVGLTKRPDYEIAKTLWKQQQYRQQQEVTGVLTRTCCLSTCCSTFSRWDTTSRTPGLVYLPRVYDLCLSFGTLGRQTRLGAVPRDTSSPVGKVGGVGEMFPQKDPWPAGQEECVPCLGGVGCHRLCRVTIKGHGSG